MGPTSVTLIVRTAVGALASVLIAALARRTHSLSNSGAVAAAIVGTSSVAAGWDWGALLLAFFLSSTALSKLGQAKKSAITAGILEKGNARDAAQVIANGGIYALAAIAALLWSTRWIAAFGAGALAVSTSDTWATEIGTLVGGTPHSILRGGRVPTGTSGGVTWRGGVAALTGAAFIAGLVALLGWGLPIAGAAAAGGIVGSTVDSLLGAAWQSRRWCPTCETSTERRVHHCGTATQPHSGVAWLDNDAVNLVSSAAGALLSAIVAA